MTFDELVQDVMDRLNYTSTDARRRVGGSINDTYRQVTSAIGLTVSRRFVKNVTISPTLPSLPDYIVDGMEKVLRIAVLDTSGTVRVLDELTFDEISNERVFRREPRAFAIKRMGAHNVTITFDAHPEDDGDPFTLAIEGYELTPELADDVEPAFPADFHDILVEGVLIDELLKMEKPALAAYSDRRYDQRLSDLKMFIAKSAYLDIVQGKETSRFTRASTPWWKNL